MKYLKVNDETEYIYWVVQKFFLPPPITGFSRDKAKEQEFYALKTPFKKQMPHACGWKLTDEIPMYDGRSGIRYRVYSFCNNEKNAIVSALYQDDGSLSYGHPETPIFFGQQGISTVLYIVFSDNLIIAKNLQANLQLLSTHPVWAAVSFLQKSDLQKLDFSIFSGKTIIYHLVEHSGNDWRDACLNAADIIKLFPKDATVYVMSYPERNVNPHNPFPAVFLSTREYFEEEVNELQKQPANISTIRWSTPRPLEHPQISAGLLARTLTWIYDAGARDRTLFLTQCAASLSQGSASIQSHKRFSPRKTAYLYINADDDGFASGIQEAFECMFDQKYANPQPPVAPSSISDAEMILCKRDMFLSYPLAESPFSKIKPNFFYTLFWPGITQGKTIASAMMELLNRVFENLTRFHSDIEIIFLDIPFLWSYGIPITKLMSFFYFIRSQYTVILSTNAPGEKRHGAINNLPFDKIIQMQRERSESTDIAINLIYERDDINRQKRIERLIKGIKDKRWKNRPIKKMTVKEKLQYVTRHRNDPLQEIAENLGISISYVKKLRGLAGVSNKIPARAPKHPRRKPADYSIG